ncbi:MAG: CHAT domain-containing protein [Xenococcaceae cyanobacterium MO_188.B32]|nr:CHAT domain-containing protein [Xenococcaceae cyanobacterium MO_188.B32]
MARKWHTFHRTVESFFLKLIPLWVSFVKRRAYRLMVLLVLGIFLSVDILPGLSQIPVNQSQNGAEELVEQGSICYETEQFSEVLESLPPEERAQKLVEQGQICYGKGQISEAVNYLQRAIDNFETRRDWNNLAITSTNLSRIFQELGQYTRACSTLEQALEPDLQFCQDQDSTEENPEEVNKTLPQLPDRIQVVVWRSFGDVLRVIGKLKESEIVLEKALNLTDEPNALAATRLSLGNTYRAWGNLERDRRAEPKYEYIPWRCENQGTFNQEIQGYYDEARRRYEKVIIREPPSEEDNSSAHKEKYQQLVITQSKESSLSAKEIKAQLNLLSLLVQTGEVDYAQKLSEFIQISHLPTKLKSRISRVTVYAQINFAKSLACLKQKISTDNLSEEQIKLVSWENINNLLETAFQDAEELEDRRAASYALGDRGGLYEYLGWLDEQPQQEKKAEESRAAQKLCQDTQECREEAKQWTEKALELLQRREEDETLSLIQLSESPELGYQWQWQLGRLFKAEGQREEAIANYEAAIKTLESVRSDLLAINSDVQFNFRDNVEPLYRELVALLLPVWDKNPSQEKLKKAVYYVDSLQLAELENFLRCNLQGEIETVQIQQISKPNDPIEELFTEIDRILDNYPTKAAFIYPILLKNQISVILKLPGETQELEYYNPEIDKENSEKEIKETLASAQKSLTEKIQSKYTPEPLKKLYKWIIGEKFANKLKQEKIENLIFVLDSGFRTIPMSALLDNEQFVVQKNYVTSVIPGVQLLRSKSAKSPDRNALIMSAKDTYDIVTQKNLNAQIDFIENTLTNAKINFKTINQNDYKKANLKEELKLKSYSLIHIAAHGRFNSNPDEAYIKISDEDQIKINELGNLLQNRNNYRTLELLFLSSCSTAKGDNRSVLGFAGIAVKSEARGTIAPIWSVEQPVTNEIVERFYQYLDNQANISNSEALHFAQNSLIDNPPDHVPYILPYHWAAFVLVGN